MKKYILMSFAALLSASCFTSCKEDLGTEPGNDSNAVVTVYQSNPGEGYNADNDVALRFVGNGKVSAMYYLAMPTSEYEEALKSLGEAGMQDKVVKEGEKLEFVEEALEGIPTAETVLTGCIGSYTIAVVATSGSSKKLYTSEFVGLEWETVTTGYYHYRNAYIVNYIIGSQYSEDLVELQHCTTEGKGYRYRLVNPFGEGSIMNFESMGEDYMENTPDGPIQYVRIQHQKTGLVFGENGPVYVQDIASWQGNDVFASTPDYICYMYLEDGWCEFSTQYECTAGHMGFGYVGAGSQDQFIPAMYFE